MIRISNVENYPFFKIWDEETGIEIKFVTEIKINTPLPHESPTTVQLTVIAEVDIRALEIVPRLETRLDIDSTLS